MSRASEAARKAYPVLESKIGIDRTIAYLNRRIGYEKGYEMGAQHMLTSAREWWKVRLRGFVGDGIAEGMVNEFCEDMEEDYE